MEESLQAVVFWLHDQLGLTLAGYSPAVNITGGLLSIFLGFQILKLVVRPLAPLFDAAEMETVSAMPTMKGVRESQIQGLSDVEEGRSVFVTSNSQPASYESGPEVPLESATVSEFRPSPPAHDNDFESLEQTRRAFAPEIVKNAGPIVYVAPIDPVSSEVGTAPALSRLVTERFVSCMSRLPGLQITTSQEEDPDYRLDGKLLLHLDEVTLSLSARDSKSNDTIWQDKRTCIPGELKEVQNEMAAELATSLLLHQRGRGGKVIDLLKRGQVGR